MKSLKEKLNSVEVNSNFKTLSKSKLMKIFGGNSCTTGSSDKCDNLCRCNCPPPPIIKKPSASIEVVDSDGSLY